MEFKIIQHMAEGQASHWWFQARAQIISRMIKKTFGIRKLNILEIGAGTGACIPILKQHGPVTVIEPDPICRRHLQQKFDIRAIPGSIPDSIPMHLGKFDLICMFDVLEHIDDDEEALKSLRTLLTPNGHIFVTVPAYQWLWSPLDTLSHHKRRYSAQKLRKLISRTELEISKLTYFNTTLFPVAAITRKLDQAFKKNSSTGYQPPHKYINWILKQIFLLEKYLLPVINLPFGLSLLTVLNKKSAALKMKATAMDSK